MREPDHDLHLHQKIADRALPGCGRPSIERMETGSSTPVYRIHPSGITCFLRLAEGPRASLAPEAFAHDLLRARGGRVPEIIHFDSFHQQLQRSVMVTTAIPGRSPAEHSEGFDAGPMLAAAGRDLAIINGVELAGFGFVRCDSKPKCRPCVHSPSAIWRNT